MPTIAPAAPPHPLPGPDHKPAADANPLHEAAKAFEAVFLAEMLSAAGLGEMPEGFGGGAGEDAFASFLTRAYGEKLAASGSFGLADAIVRAATPAGPFDA